MIEEYPAGLETRRPELAAPIEEEAGDPRSMGAIYRAHRRAATSSGAHHRDLVLALACAAYSPAK